MMTTYVNQQKMKTESGIKSWLAIQAKSDFLETNTLLKFNHHDDG
jgi:hypothetical protein